MPKWWNGRHKGLKIPGLFSCTSSSLVLGTIFKRISMTQLELVKEIETLAYKLRTYINEPVHLTPNDKHRYIENKIKIYFEKVDNLKKEYYERDC